MIKEINNMNTKPILLVELPVNISDIDHIKHISVTLNKLLGDDYYVILNKNSEIKNITYKILSVNNVTEIELNDLKNILNNEIKG